MENTQKDEEKLSFAQKARRLTLTIFIMLLIEIGLGIFCYLVGILKYFFLFYGICFLVTIVGFIYMEVTGRNI